MKEKDGMIFVSYLMQIESFKTYYRGLNFEQQLEIIDNLTNTSIQFIKEYEKQKI